MLQQQGLCGDGADATRAEEFGESDQQVDGEDDEFAHGAHRTMTTSVHKTAPHSRIASYYEFATHSAADSATRTTVIDCSPAHQNHFQTIRPCVHLNLLH